MSRLPFRPTLDELDPRLVPAAIPFTFVNNTGWPDSEVHVAVFGTDPARKSDPTNPFGFVYLDASGQSRPLYGPDLPYLAATTLTAPLDASATTVTVSSTNGFPAVFVPTFAVQVDGEALLVTGPAAGGATWNVVRGFGNTSKAAHAAGAAVKLAQQYVPNFTLDRLPGGVLTLPDGATLNSARVLIGVGADVVAPVNTDAVAQLAGGNTTGAATPVANNASDPNLRRFYDYFELTLSGGAANGNLSQVDQFGFPVVLSVTGTGGEKPTTRVGTIPARDAVLSGYAKFTAGTPFGLALSAAPADPSGLAYRILSPADVLFLHPTVQMTGTADGSATVSGLADSGALRIGMTVAGAGVPAGATVVGLPPNAVALSRPVPAGPVALTFTDPAADTSALATYFTGVLGKLFETGANDLTLSVPNPGRGQDDAISGGDPQFYKFVGTRATVTAPDLDGVTRTYRVLRFATADTVAGRAGVTFDVYDPRFSSNTADPARPPAPRYLTVGINTRASGVESPGAMVLGNDGVFADNVLQFPNVNPVDFRTNPTALLSNLLGNIENQLVSAVNRGVALRDAADWGTTANFYAPHPSNPGSVWNYYAQYLHQPTVSIDGKTYAFGYDDQAGQSSDFGYARLDGIEVDLKPWATTKLTATGAAAGDGPLVRVFNPDGSERFRFLAFDPAFRGGVNVATGDVTGDGVDDIVAAAGVGGGPHVRVFDGATGRELAGFFAYDAGFRGGVAVAVGDADGDGRAEVVTAAGPGGGPHVRVWDGRRIGGARGADGLPARLADYFAFDPGFRGGVRLAVADLDGDGRAEVAAAAGPGGGPHVVVHTVRADRPVVRASFFALPPDDRGGLVLEASNTTGDGRPKVLIRTRPDGEPIRALADLSPL